MSNMGIYLIGFAILIIGLCVGAFALGAPPMWIGIGALILIGIGIISGISKTRIKESSPEDTGRKTVIVDE